jgi:hypothetical protein
VGERTGELRKEQPKNAQVIRALDEFEGKVAPLGTGDGDRADDLNLKAIGGVLRSVATDVEATDRAPTETQRRVVEESAARLDRALTAWKSLRDTSLPKLNAALAAARLEPIEIPPVDRIQLGGPSESREIP